MKEEAYLKLLSASAFDHGSIPETHEGAGSVNVEKAHALLLEQYAQA